MLKQDKLILIPSILKTLLFKSSSIFGGVSEKRKSDVKNENSHTIYVNATCIFGGVDIK